jgi:hypothetical protein
MTHSDNILDDSYPLAMTVNGIAFTSCKHALEASPYFTSCPNFAQVIADEKHPERREILVKRIKVQTHRGAPRWQREINQRIDKFSEAVPPLGWDREEAYHAVRLVKFSMAVCKDALFSSDLSARPDLVKVANDLRKISIRPENPLLCFFHITIAEEAKISPRSPDNPIYEESHYDLYAPDGATAARMMLSTLADRAPADKPVRCGVYGLPRFTKEFLLDLDKESPKTFVYCD